jgi:ABC-type antimicrobial peptide transport system permease subunit
MVLSEGGLLVAMGLVLGVIGSMALARLIRGLLYGVEPYDPATMISVAVLMMAIGLASSWLPAVRASRIAPSEALRAQ